jgi:hypothetical protein
MPLSSCCAGRSGFVPVLGRKVANRESLVRLIAISQAGLSKYYDTVMEECDEASAWFIVNAARA